MKIFLTTAALVAVASLTFSSCRQADDDVVPPVDTLAGPGTVKMEFFHRAGGSSLAMNGQKYVNASGDTFSVTKFNYYVSNIRLNKADGSSWSESESYHLVQHGTEASMTWDMPNIPAGDYTSITYTIGVDSARNVSGAQTGALDPANGMFWSWNSGYIMMKFEGTSPSSPNTGGAVLLHAGGFKGTNNALRTATLPLPSSIAVGSKAVQHIHLTADVMKLLNTPNPIAFSTTHTIHMPGTAANKMADNYAGMFTVTHAGP